MSNIKKKISTYDKSYIVHHHELPLSCPTEAMALWSSHPKVYLPIDKTGVEKCPYCGTKFVLQDD